MNVKPKLLDQVRAKIRLKHYNIRTGQTDVDWIRRYILFHDKRHPQEMGNQQVEQFLSHLAVERNVAASTQNQALSAIVPIRHPSAGGRLRHPHRTGTARP